MHDPHDTPERDGKAEFLTFLRQLQDYVEGGIYDYLKDNSIDDYLEHGDGLKDFVVLDAIARIRAWVTEDTYPWWIEGRENPYA